MSKTAKTVLITGSSVGIGAATAQYFQNMGWNVAATKRTLASGNQIEEDAAQPNLLKVKLDVTDDNSIDFAVEKTHERFGAIDVLVNNAGYGMVGAFEASSAEQVERQFSTNVFGLMKVTRAVLPKMRERKEGTIINISSVGGKVTFPLYSVYHATKFAVEGFSESLQYELQQFNIRVKLVEPGPIKTQFYDRSQDLVSRPNFHFYDDFVARTLPNLQQSGHSAPGPEIVAKTIYRAATDNSCRLRYPVNSAPILMLRKLIPDALVFAIVKSRLIK